MTEELIRVLMVDDDQDDYVLVRDMLTAAGFQFCLDWVDTYDAALQTIRRAEHQAYLFDLFLGVPDGLELLRAALADGCEAPIIMLTGLGNRRVDMQAMQAGAADFLDKGQLSPQLLERSIRYAIERKRVEGLLRAQRDLGFSAQAARGLGETLRLCLETAIDLTKMDCGGVYLVDEASGDVKLAHHTGFGTSFVKHVSRYEADSARARLVRAGQSIYQRNQDLDGPASTLVRAEGLRSLAIVPVRYQERVIGCLNVASHTLNEVPEFARTVFETLVTQIGNAIIQSQAEEALRQSQADLQTLFDTVDDFLIVLDMRGRILQVNQVLLQRLGYSQAELVGESMLKLRSPDRHDEAAAILKDMLAGIADGCSIPLMTSEGVQIPVETRIARGHWDNQPALFGISRDITHQVRAEQERARLLDGLREQVKLIHQIMDAVPEGVFLLDTRARIIIANPAAREHLHAIANVRVGDIVTHLGDRPIQDLLAAPAQPGRWHEIACAVPHEAVFELVARPMEEESETGGHVVVIRDITEERDIQRQVQQQERLATVGQLAAGIAHDFNNLMASIILYSSLMLRASPLLPDDRQRLETIRQQGRLAADLTQQILDFGRSAVLQRRDLNLPSFLEDLRGLLDHTLPSDISLFIGYQDERITVNVDPTRLQQLVLNLAINARDAMPDGGELTIRLERTDGEDGGEQVLMTVADSGTGIPADVLPHVFEPFFTTKTPHGSGLGLSQVYGIIKQHDGDIEVASKPGLGTTFTITFPAVRAQAAP